MFLEAESGEVDTRAKDLCLCQDTDTTDTINLHLHVWVAVRVAEVSQMRTPGSVLCITLHNYGILVEGVCKRERGF